MTSDKKIMNHPSFKVHKSGHIKYYRDQGFVAAFEILDKEGNRFEGFSGLAMLLIDLDYRASKPFDMDKTVFAKDIKEDGSVGTKDLTKSVGLIAIDKHGNESNPFNLE